MPTNFAGSGYLSQQLRPVQPRQRPGQRRLHACRTWPCPAASTPERFATRRNMLDAVNDHFAGKEKSDNLDAMDTFYQRAYGLISSEKARDAFDINAEDAKLRDEYGRNAAGQRMLHGPPAGRSGRALRVADLRRLGPARRHRRRHQEPAAAVRPGVRDADHATCDRAGCSTAR